MSAPLRRRYAAQRGGLLALAGVSRLGSESFARIDIAIPTPVPKAPRLRLLLVTELSRGEDELGTRVAQTRSVAVTPAFQTDWHLPFGPASGDLVLAASAGVTFLGKWVRLPDEPFWPASWKESSSYLLRLAVGPEYRARNGLVVALPIAFARPLSNAEAPDARWMEPANEAKYIFAILAGYQFR